jgi:hypothetical protein
MTTHRAPADIHPKVQAAGVAGVITSIVVYLLSAFVFTDNPVPEDLINLIVLLIPVVVSFTAGYLKTGDQEVVTDAN